MINAKAKGSRNEWRSIALLTAAGYSCTRAAASLGVFDIIAIGNVDILLVQVKTRDWPGRAEIERIRQFPAPAICRKLIHRWRPRQAAPDVREL